MKINTSSDHFLIKKSDFKDLFNIMKICLFLLFAFAFQLMATNTNAQDAIIELRSNSVTVSQLISEIEKQTDYLVVYSNREVNTSRTVSLKNKSDKVSEYLNQTFSGTDIGYDFEKNYIVLSKKAEETASILTNLTQTVQQQGKTVRGTVTDSNGEPVIGATIVVQGDATKGTVTDIDGNFILSNLPENAVLQVTYVGMKPQEIITAGRNIIDVLMEADTELLDEVVVVGYGTQRSGEITGAVSTAKIDQISNIPTAQTSAALKGQLPGVTVTASHKPGDNAIIRVRGLGTINNNDPLWVVDGVPGASVPLEDIESISVLKDASSQAIYGSRAANGVILVTTKSGKSGQKAKIRASIKTGISQNTRDYGLLNTQEYGEYLWLRAKNSGVQNYSHALYGNGPTPVIPEYIFPARAENVDHSLYDNLMIHEDGTDTYLITKANKEGTDWLSEITRNALYQQYGIDISGGSADTKYAFVGNYLNQEGILNYTSFERYNLRSNISSKLTDWLEIGEKLSASLSTSKGNRSDQDEASVMSFSYRMQPIVPVYDIAGNFAGTRAPETGNGKNPAFMLYASRNAYNKLLDVNGNLYANVSFLKDFKFQSLFGFILHSNSNKNFNYVEVAHSERGTYDGLSQSESTMQQWNWSNTLQYDKSINQHNLNVLLGLEAVANEYKIISGSRSEFFNKSPIYMQLNVGQRDITNGGNMSQWTLFSQFARINYNYALKYFLQATIRRDGSSRFGHDNRYGVFPAFSLGWNISEEEFLQQTKSWLDNLRIRFGWGTTGNDQIGNYNSYSTFASSTTGSYYPIDGSNSSAASGFYANAIGNPGARWEKTITTNLGIDAVFLSDFNFNFDIWKRKTDDMLYNVKIPNVLGSAAAPAVNIGAMDNFGVDLNLGYQGKALANELLYGISLNFSHYKNKLIKLSDRENEFITGPNLRNHIYTRAEPGKEFPYFYGYIVDGIFQSEEEANAHPRAFGENGVYNVPGHFKFRDVNDDGVINDMDRTDIGSPHPDFTAGLNLNFEYKNFTLSTFLYSSYGNDVMNVPRRYIDFNTFSGNRSKRALYESWGSPYLKDNSQAIMPMVDLSDAGGHNSSTYYVEDGSYLRMENLTIGYNFNNLFNKYNKIQIYTQISNLFTLTKYSGLDPEIGRGGMYTGIDSGGWPTPRQYIFGINFEF